MCGVPSRSRGSDLEERIEHITDWLFGWFLVLILAPVLWILTRPIIFYWWIEQKLEGDNDEQRDS
jgi:hypothetical protein